MLRKVVDFCAKTGFLKIVESSSYNKIQYALGLPGSLLEENLKREWFDNFLNSKEIPVFYSKDNFRDTFVNARGLLNNVMPFGIIEISPIAKKSHTRANISETQSDSAKLQENFSDCLINDSKLIYTMFMAPSMANHSFHQIQRQRKIWWRKISASPGRYHLSDIRNGDTNSDSPKSLVNIDAKYPWGKQMLESINLYSNRYPGIGNPELLIKDGKKEVPAVYIQCVSCMSNLLLNSLCDAYEEPLFQNEKRALMRFHRKIAPFKIGFSMSSSMNTESLNELQDLALYLTKLLRQNYVTTLHLPSNVKKTLDGQYKQYDELGIPYTIYLNESTLKDGIAWLRSRDSTLKEQVHVAELVQYIEKIYKNF